MFEPVKWEGGNTACPPSVFRRYIEHNRERGLARIEVGKARKEPLYIACAGPSLSDTWEELKGREGQLWALNAAYDWVKGKGIKPDYGVCLACEDQILRYFQGTATGDKFLFATQTHPALVDRVIAKGGDVTFWNPAHPADWDLPLGDGPQIHGGGTVGTRAIDLAWVLGYREIHLFGLDACLSPDGRIGVDIPMYEDRREDLRTWVVNGRAFVALPSHARQVEDFGSIIRPLNGLSVTLYGDGLMQWAHRSENGQS